MTSKWNTVASGIPLDTNKPVNINYCGPRNQSSIEDRVIRLILSLEFIALAATRPVSVLVISSHWDNLIHYLNYTDFDITYGGKLRIDVATSILRVAISCDVYTRYDALLCEAHLMPFTLGSWSTLVGLGVLYVNVGYSSGDNRNNQCIEISDIDSSINVVDDALTHVIHWGQERFLPAQPPGFYSISSLGIVDV